MSKIAILGDTHFDIFSGVKQERMYQYQQKFFKEVFFPYLIKHNIKTVIQTGDLFDKRTSISQRSIKFAKTIFFDVLKVHNIDLHVLTGNHDIYYRDTLEIVTASQVLGEYNNITLYNTPTQKKIYEKNYSFIPWICKANEADVADFIKTDTSTIAIGHLELAGARLSKHSINEHGTEPGLFKKYNKVYSGHFHTKSVCDNVDYVGTPYELTRVDANDQKSFIVIEDGQPDIVVQNPFTIYEQITINDATELKKALTGDYNNKYVEIYIEYEETADRLFKFSKKLTEDYDMYDCQIVPKRQQQDNELLTVDTSTLKNNAELIDAYAETNNLSAAVALKLKTLYNQATSNLTE